MEYVTGRGPVRAVDGVSFAIAPSEVFGLAGESGSGKSTIAHAILRLLHPPAVITGGQVLFEYVQDPLPPPIGAGHQVFRSVSVANGGFRDWFGPHDVHVYRFGL